MSFACRESLAWICDVGLWPAACPAVLPDVHHLRSSHGLANGSGWPANNRRETSRSREAMMRSEEHTSELQSLMRIAYAVFCLTKKQTQYHTHYLIFTHHYTMILAF